MVANDMAHPYDEHGKRRPLSELPDAVHHMRDDPFRSLEAFVQLVGVYRKVKQAYPDFRWSCARRQGMQAAGLRRQPSLRRPAGRAITRPLGYLRRRPSRERFQEPRFVCTQATDGGNARTAAQLVIHERLDHVGVDIALAA